MTRALGRNARLVPVDDVYMVTSLTPDGVTPVFQSCDADLARRWAELCGDPEACLVVRATSDERSDGWEFVTE